MLMHGMLTRCCHPHAPPKRHWSFTLIFLYCRQEKREEKAKAAAEDAADALNGLKDTAAAASEDEGNPEDRMMEAAGINSPSP